MAYEVLARKWRPQTFEDVIGQDHITQTLANAIRTNRLAHAYLFAGPRGVGKTSVARILAKTINCEHGEPGIPCNRCSSCNEITTGSSVDVQEIDGASNRGIDEIRELRENIKYMPSSSRYRIYVIDEVHMLTKEAFNALLKTLEEPPSHVKFIFATTEAHKVPVTILSRCQRFDFKRIPVLEIMAQLERITQNERIQISKSGLRLIAREAEGSLRDAESLLDQLVSFSGLTVEDQHVAEVLGIIDTDIVFDASRAIIQRSASGCMEIVERIYNYGYDLKEFYGALMNQFRDLLLCLHGPQEHLLDMNESDREKTQNLAEEAGAEKLQAMLQLMINQEERLRFSSHPRLILETTMVNLSQMGEYLSFGELLLRLESLERRLSGSPVDLEPDRKEENPTHAARQTQVFRDESDATGEKPTWEGFLAFLSTENKAMYNVVRGWQFRELGSAHLEIAKAGRPFSYTYFDEPKRLDQLSAYCRKFFQRDLKIKIVDASPTARKAQSPVPKEAPQPEPDNLSAPVQDILHMFQGEIVKSRPGKGVNSKEVKK